MRASRVALVVWTLVIIVLVVLEIAEVTRLFKVPVLLALQDPVAVAASLVFTTIIAVIGAIFIGISLTARLLSSQGFTPFEEEMLRMRGDLAEVKASVEEIRSRVGGAPPPPPSQKGGLP